MKKLLLIIIIFCGSLLIFSQPQIRPTRHILFSEIYKVPQDSLNKYYFIYKIPYNRLVFEKKNSDYSAGYRLSVEVFDSVSGFVARKIKENRISVFDFEKTDEGEIYSEGILEFELSLDNNYNFLPILVDVNSDREIKIDKINYVTKKEEDGIYLNPLVVNSSSSIINNKEIFTLSNFNGGVPFSRQGCNLIIPSVDTSLAKIYVIIINNKDTLLSGEMNDSFVSDLSITEKDDEILLNNGNNGKNYRNFIIPDINKNIKEGALLIKVSKSSDAKSFATFRKGVNWYNKPFSLMDPEFAIQSLKYIEQQKLIDELLDVDEKDYYKTLFKFWQKKDPTPETSFNELMNEYYSRVDYSLKNFSSLTGKKGSETDRGKIFIMFGKPNELVRSSTEMGKVMETWIYKNPERKFIFVDDRGIGEYHLKNG